MKKTTQRPLLALSAVTIGMGFLSACASGSAGATEARFSDYPAEAALSGAAARPDFNGRDASHSQMRTRILNGVSEGVNFAGHYSMIEIGCGSSCRFAKIVDLRTGEVGNFPYGGEEQYQMKMDYVPGSRLVKTRWMGEWDSPDCTEVDIVIEGMDWRIAREGRAPKINGFCDY